MSKSYKNLINKNSLITGANRGIGLKILEKFAKEGSDIIACARSKNIKFEEKIKFLEKQNNVKIYISYFDLSDVDNMKEELIKIKSKFKNIDILVNNAGEINTSSFLMTPIKNFERLLKINYVSQIHLMQYVSKLMIAQKHGNIINISSSSGLDANEGRIAYSASKAALINSSRILSKELSSFNIRVNVIAPGLIETDMMLNNTKKEVIENMLKNLSTKRVGKPEEVANVAYFLASEMSSYINGQIIRVDGGML